MRTVDEYIDLLPAEQQELCDTIRRMILDLVPGIEERFSFRLPFYHYYGMFLYLSASKEGIRVTFCRGKDLVIAFPQLQQNNRAIAAHVTLHDHADIAKCSLRELIVAAADWNEEAKRLKIPMVKAKKNLNGKK